MFSFIVYCFVSSDLVLRLIFICSISLFLLSSLLCYFFCSLLLSLSVCICCFKFPSFLLHFCSVFPFSTLSLLLTVFFTFFFLYSSLSLQFYFLFTFFIALFLSVSMFLVSQFSLYSLCFAIPFNSQFSIFLSSLFLHSIYSSILSFLVSRERGAHGRRKKRSVPFGVF